MLELVNVCFKAEQDGIEKVILDNVNLKIENGFTAITGPNGGGKSTLAKIIAGIITPTSGKILLNGKDITNLSITERAKEGVAFAFQQPVRFKGITVKDLIGFAKGENVSVGEACKYLSEVGLCAKEYVNREVNASLSGGELKRIEIATVLARQCTVTIFDEPEAGIDLWSFSSLIKVFEQLNKKLSGSVVIISHQERILSIADNVVVIKDGKVLKSGAANGILPTLLNSGGLCSVLEEKI